MRNAAAAGDDRQSTARRLVGDASADGFGLMTGARISMRLSPAPAGAGIAIRRTDRRGRGAVVRPDWRTVARTLHSTCLESPSGARVYQVEHMLSALNAAGVADATIEVDGPELPFFDGSVTPYCDILLDAGLAPAEPPRAVHILRPFEFRTGETVYRFEPAPRLELDINIALYHFGPLRWHGQVDWEDFRAHIAPARSFHRLAFRKTIPLAAAWLRNRLDGAGVVLFRDRTLNPDGLRMPDEMVRHRVIDALGDLTLIGAPLCGRFIATYPSHAKNRAAVEALMSTPDAWRQD